MKKLILVLAFCSDCVLAQNSIFTYQKNLNETAVYSEHDANFAGCIINLDGNHYNLRNLTLPM